MKKLLIPFTLLGAAAFAANDKPEPKAMDVTFLCVSPPNATKYQAGKDGLFRTVLEDPRTLPPSVVYCKIGKKYEPVQLNTNSLTFPKRLEGDADAMPSEFFIKDETPTPDGKKRDEKWLPFVSLGNMVDGAPKLVCLSKAQGSQYWQPPQVRVIDITPTKFPESSLLVINLMSAPALVQIGGNGRPARLESGKNIVVPASKNEEGTVIIKVARETSGSIELVANTGKMIDTGKRGVLVVYDANKAYAGRNADILFQQLATRPPDAAPSEEKPSEKL